MAKSSFDYKGALDAGYSDEEISSHLRESNPKFDYQAAQEAGYSPQQINQHLSTYKPEKSLVEQGARLGGQFLIGAAENALLPYELGAAHLAQPEAAQVNYKQQVMEDIEDMQQRKQLGEWSPQDEEHLQHLVGQIKDPSKTEPFVQTADIGVRGLAEKATGQDLHPEGVLEKAAGWIGFLKDPKKLIGIAKELPKIGLKPKELFKVLRPGTEELRGLTAGSALEMAEQGHLGPLGTLASAIVGDIAGFGPKGLIHIAKNPKKAAAELTNFLTMNNNKRAIAKEFAKDAKASGLTLDVGTLTQSPLVQFIQARAAQSGLTGNKLQEFRKQLSGQIIREYEAVADNLGNLRFENTHQASEAIKEALKTEEISLNAIPKGEQQARRSLQGRISTQEPPDYNQELLNRISPHETPTTYEGGETLKTVAEDIKRPISEEFEQRWTNLNRQIEQIPAGPQGELGREMARFAEEHEGSLLLGESAPEARVVRAARDLSERLVVEGGEVGVTLNQLIKTKRTLADVANWEFGGSNFASAYKKLVGDIDNAIQRTLERVSPELREQYQHLNAEYSAFKDLFENKNVIPLFEPKNQNNNAIYNSFISNPDKLRSLEDMLYASPRGQEMLGQIKRDMANRVISNPHATHREIRDLGNALGPQHDQDLINYLRQRNEAVQAPLRRPTQQPQINIAPQRPNQAQTSTAKTRQIKPGVTAERTIKESPVSVRKKLSESISKKTPDQIFKMMDSIEGIRKLKKSLSTTEEGRQLFKDLSRYKLDEMIMKNMTNSMNEQVKLGTFSGLLKSTENKALVKELLGPEAFDRLRLLQKNSGRLAESAEKFFNASKSGTTATDVGLISGTIVAVLTGNPFLALSGIGSIGGMRVISNLISDPQYLKYLEQAMLTPNKQKFINLLSKMQPSVGKAVLDAKESQR